MKEKVQMLFVSEIENTLGQVYLSFVNFAVSSEAANLIAQLCQVLSKCLC